MIFVAARDCRGWEMQGGLTDSACIIVSSRCETLRENNIETTPRYDSRSMHGRGWGDIICYAFLSRAVVLEMQRGGGGGGAVGVFHSFV